MANRLKKSTIAPPEEKEVKEEKRGKTAKLKETGQLKKDKEESVDLKKRARDERTWKIVGTISLLFSIFLFIAFVSYFFTFGEDGSQVSRYGVDILLRDDIKVSNLLGRLGAYVS